MVTSRPLPPPEAAPGETGAVCVSTSEAAVSRDPGLRTARTLRPPDSPLAADATGSGHSPPGREEAVISADPQAPGTGLSRPELRQLRESRLWRLSPL